MMNTSLSSDFCIIDWLGYLLWISNGMGKERSGEFKRSLSLCDFFELFEALEEGCLKNSLFCILSGSQRLCSHHCPCIWS
jgi:hypothetical protein